MEPDGPESTKRVDSSDSDSSSESCPTSGPKPVENVISPSGVEVYASTQSTQIASGAGQSLADVVRSPILARKSVDIWKKYHKKRRVKKAIIERNGAFFKVWSIRSLKP